MFVNTEDRSQLYYGQFQWAVSWRQSEVSALRQGLDSLTITKTLRRRKSWSQTRYKIQSQYSRNDYINLDYDSVEYDLQILAAKLTSTPHRYKIVVSSDNAYVYTNSKDFVDELVLFAASLPLVGVNVKQVIVSGSPDCIVFKKPYAFQYRTLLRSKKLESHTKQAMQSWLQAMQTEIKACPSLIKYLVGNSGKSRYYRSQWTGDNYFIDHNDVKLETWISMISPGLVKKTITIQSPK